MPDSPELAVSTVIFALREDPQGRLRLALPLVRRIRSPFEGFWALPGGPLGAAESLADAAARTLEQTTGLETNYLEQLYAFGGINRSARQGQQGGEQLAARGRPIGNDRVVSIVYWALVGAAEAEHTRDDPNVKWQFIGELPELAFDHNLIVEYALWRLRNKVSYSRVAHAFLPERFTLAELREVYEVLLGRELDPANFRRGVEASGAVLATGERLAGAKHRPPMLYRYNAELELSDHGPLGAAALKR